MREIKNNIEVAKLQPKHDLKNEKFEKSEPAFCANEEEKCVKDFSNPSEILGRSQVKVNKMNMKELENDINFGMNNPDHIAMAEKIFDSAYEKYQDYGKATEIMNEAMQLI